MALETIAAVILPRLLAASVQSTLLISVVWLLCRWLPGLPANTRVALSWLVAVQLVVGLVWSSPLALPLLPGELPPMAAAGAAAFDPALATSSLGGAASAAQASPVFDGAVQVPAWSWPRLLALCWLLGLSFMLARTLGGYLQTRALLRASLPCRDSTLVAAVELAAEAHGLSSAPRMRLSGSIQSPQLLGPWRPVLLLPERHEQDMDADELDMALTHELMHLRRGDLWWGLLPAAAQHLFFFHPLVHLAVREYALAREVACDAAVIAGRRHLAGGYGRLLVRIGVAARPTAGLASASPDFQILKRRLIMLQLTATTPRAVALLLTVAVAMVGIVPYRVVAAAPLQAPAHIPAPPAALTPVIVAAPAAPAVEVPAAPAPAWHATEPAPPAPPAAPQPQTGIPAGPAPLPNRHSSSSTTLPRAGDEAYVLLRGQDSLTIGDHGDLEQARTLRNGGDILLLRQGAARYVVRDAATLERFSAAFDQVNRLGKSQGELGARQGQLGQQQGRLGQRQGQIGEQQARLAGQHVLRLGAASDSGSAAAAEATHARRMADLGTQQTELGREMDVLGQLQNVLGKQQGELGRQQTAASALAERQARQIAADALARGVAQPVRD